MGARNRGYSEAGSHLPYYLNKFRDELMRDDNLRREALKKQAKEDIWKS